MHPHVFLLLLSSGVSSYFLPQKEMPRWLNKVKYPLVDEMLCLLEGENARIKVNLSTPVYVKKPDCAPKNAEIFIHGLKKLHKWTCMKKVEKDMEELEKNCSIFKKSSFNKSCSKKSNTDFSEFKASLEEFLRWINQKQNCKNVGRSKFSFYPVNRNLDGKCSCHDPWKSHQALG
uniref:Interleukin-7 n=1 Tax=Zonotrichia albicollis TaxID=44394 RepID=A0A8D2MQG6_ZONAL|nr:uncharacterized protein LOC102060734 [Zonotrichia albicollis]